MDPVAETPVRVMAYATEWVKPEPSMPLTTASSLFVHRPCIDEETIFNDGPAVPASSSAPTLDADEHTLFQATVEEVITRGVPDSEAGAPNDSPPENVDDVIERLFDAPEKDKAPNLVFPVTLHAIRTRGVLMRLSFTGPAAFPKKN